MTGVKFVTDAKGRKSRWLISESRRKEKSIPFKQVKADLVKRGRLRA
jgi:hypothetical protein